MKTPRQANDFYETPPDYIDSLLRWVSPLSPTAIVVDPCSGQGAISNHLRLVIGCDVVTNDIDRAMPSDYHYDATEGKFWEVVQDAEWTVMNPPFTPELMVPIVENALFHTINTITLARLSFLEPTVSRVAFWREHPPDMCIVLPRYSFSRNAAGRRATDSVTCCWIGWGPQVPQLFTIETEHPAWRKRA